MRGIAKCHSAENYIQERDTYVVSSLILPESIPCAFSKQYLSGIGVRTRVDPGCAALQARAYGCRGPFIRLACGRPMVQNIVGYRLAAGKGECLWPFEASRRP